MKNTEKQGICRVQHLFCATPALPLASNLVILKKELVWAGPACFSSFLAELCTLCRALINNANDRQVDRDVDEVKQVCSAALRGLRVKLTDGDDKGLLVRAAQEPVLGTPRGGWSRSALQPHVQGISVCAHQAENQFRASEVQGGSRHRSEFNNQLHCGGIKGGNLGRKAAGSKGKTSHWPRVQRAFTPVGFWDQVERGM